MTTKEQLLELLASGKSVDELADELSATLNEAKKEYDERVERETAELAETTAKREAMRKVMAVCADYMLNFTNYTKDFSEEELNKLTMPTDEDIDAMCGLVENLSGTIKLMSGLKDLEFGFGKKKPEVEVTKVDLFDDMMRELGFRKI